MSKAIKSVFNVIQAYNLLSCIVLKYLNRKALKRDFRKLVIANN